MPPLSVRLNFRTGEGEHTASLVYGMLIAAFGHDRISRPDAEANADAFGPEQVLLPILGRHWATAADVLGRPLISRDDDPVRREIAAALARGCTVVPVLTEDAAIPAEHDLPRDLRALAWTRYLRLSTRETGYASLIAGLIGLVPQLVAPGPAPAAPQAANVMDNRAEHGGVVMAPNGGNIYVGTVSAPEAPRWKEHWRPERPPHQFTGRAHELEALSEMLVRDGSELVYAIDGLAGIGKTALAVAWAEKVAHRFPDGRIYVNFHSYHRERRAVTADEALRELLRSTCPDMTIDKIRDMAPDELASQWQAVAHGKRLIMVWDNVRDAAQIEPLLVQQEGCSTLVTSRVQLDLDAGHRIYLDRLPVGDAVRLFVEVAKGGFGLRDVPLPVDEVGRLVEADLCMPVLVVHHAKQVRSGLKTPARILTEIEQLPRENVHQVLYDRLTVSYEQLEAELRFAFRALGAHPGKYLTVRTATAAMGCGHDETIKRFDALVQAGMAELYTPSVTAIGLLSFAYSAHDLITDYALNVAEAAGDEYGELQGRLIRHYRERVEGEPDPTWFELEYPSAMAVSLNGRSADHADLAVALGPDLMTFGHYPEAVRAFDHARHCFLDLQMPLGRARALVGLGTATRIESEWGLSADYFKEAVALFEAEGDRDGLIDGAIGFGHISRLRSDYATAADFFERAAVQAAAIGDGVRQSRALTGWAHALRLQKHREEAKRRFREAVAVGDPQGKANGIRGLGDVLRWEGDLDAAAECYREADRVYEELGDRNGQANLQLGLGSLARHQGRLEDAAEHYGSALQRFEDLGNRFGKGTALRGLGTTASDAGDPETARRYLRQALDIYEPLGNNAAIQVRAELETLDRDDR